uniref:KIB1-4 beta-propeller domain-containing protein n=1 Tax=Oryza nivara TaxID=4536 RepID=A0A0E0G7B7_ORYNI
MDSAGGNSGETYPSHLGLFAHLTVRRLGSDLIHRWLLCRQAVRRNASPFVGSRMPPEPVTGGDGTRLRQTLCVVLGGMPKERSRLELDAGVSLWAGLQPDILGIVLHFLPCLADRARMRSVCRHWRASANGHVLPPPLPLLMLPGFKFSSLSDKGDLMPVRCVPVPKEVAADDLRCVGSFDGWLVGVTPNKDRSDEYNRDADGDCFLLCHMRYNFPAYSSKTLRIINGSGEVYFRVNDIYTMSLCNVALSASPDSRGKYIVAASSDHKCASKLALWQPGMISWHICAGVDIDGPRDLTFYLGKLYVLQRYKIRLFAFEVGEDNGGLMVSRVKRCLSALPLHHPYQEGGAISCNMVVWRGELLLIIRHYSDNYRDREVLKVEVFALDVNTNPYGLTEIHSLNGDCIFVGLGGCKSFPAGLHHGVEGDHIYFVPDDWKPYDTFVYSMRDGSHLILFMKI